VYERLQFPLFYQVGESKTQRSNLFLGFDRLRFASSKSLSFGQCEEIFCLSTSRIFLMGNLSDCAKYLSSTRRLPRAVGLQN
jgi:hypothetical protein